MNIQEIKDLMQQFDTSSLREFSYKDEKGELSFSKNGNSPKAEKMEEVSPTTEEKVPAQPEKEEILLPKEEVRGRLVESPLVGVAYLAANPTEDPFVRVGDRVKKGQTLLIIEAMKVMNEVPAPCDGMVTEILVANEEMVEFGKGLVRIDDGQ